MIRFFFLIFSLIVAQAAKADIFYVDPTRAAVWEQASLQAEKLLKKQKERQLVTTAVHMLMKEEEDKWTERLAEWNEYLSTFHDALGVAAQLYGIGVETVKLQKNVYNLQESMWYSPTNAVAVAFSGRRNDVYVDILNNSLEILSDLKKACLANIKMTELERGKIIFGIRPKMQVLNRKLRSLNLMIKYTTMRDVWMEVNGRAYNYTHRSRAEIIRSCMDNWKNLYRR